MIVTFSRKYAVYGPVTSEIVAIAAPQDPLFRKLRYVQALLASVRDKPHLRDGANRSRGKRKPDVSVQLLDPDSLLLDIGALPLGRLVMGVGDVVGSLGPLAGQYTLGHVRSLEKTGGTIQASSSGVNTRDAKPV